MGEREGGRREEKEGERVEEVTKQEIVCYHK